MDVASMLQKMQSSEVVVATICVLLLVTLLLIFWSAEAERKRSLPPGPRPWPILGNAPLLGNGLLHRTLHALASKYGGLMYLRLGSRPCIVVSTAAVAKEVYKNNDANFASRPKLYSWTVWNDGDPNLSSLASTAYGPYWRQVKKFLNSEVFSSKHFEIQRLIRAEEVHFMMGILQEEIAQKGNQAVIDLKKWCYGLSSNHMTRLISGKRYYGTSGLEMEKERKNLQDMTRRAFKLVNTYVISDFVPYLHFITRLQGYPSRFAKERDYVKGLAWNILSLESHKERAQERRDDSNYVPNLKDVFLQAPFDGGVPMPPEKAEHVLSDFLFGGSETTATTVEWAMAELATRPDLVKRAQDELDAVVRFRRLVEEADLPHLPFLLAVVKEAMRMHPAVSLLVPHASLVPTVVLGYHFPADTLMFVNAFAIHRDPSVYQNPDQFDPDRFLARPEVNHLSGIDSYELIPFGAGRRMCPGLNIANTLVLLMLANLLYAFDWSLPDGQTGIDMTEYEGLTTSLKTPLRLLAKPRIELDI